MRSVAPDITLTVTSEWNKFVHDEIAVQFAIINRNNGRVGTDEIRKYCNSIGAMKFASATEFKKQQTLCGHSESPVDLYYICMYRTNTKRVQPNLIQCQKSNLTQTDRPASFALQHMKESQWNFGILNFLHCKSSAWALAEPAPTALCNDQIRHSIYGHSVLGFWGGRLRPGCLSNDI